ncbi:MAG: hypothetical protein ACAH83_15285 [Alphaproteobacteria bacterium]
MIDITHKASDGCEKVLNVIRDECPSMTMLFTLGNYPGRSMVAGLTAAFEFVSPLRVGANLHGLCTGTGGFTSRQKFSGSLKALEKAMAAFSEGNEKSMLKDFAAVAAVTFEAEYALDRLAYRDFSGAEEEKIKSRLLGAAQKAGFSPARQSELVGDVFEHYTEPGTYWDKLRNQNQILKKSMGLA